MLAIIYLDYIVAKTKHKNGQKNEYYGCGHACRYRKNIIETVLGKAVRYGAKPVQKYSKIND